MNSLRSSSILLIFFLTGCSIVSRNAASDDFKSAITDNTRRITIEKDFSVVLSMDIIRLNSDVVKAYVDEYSKLYMLSEDEKEKMMQQQTEENSKWNAFYLIVYTAPNTDYSLDSDSSIWKLYVESDSHAEPPVFIEQIRVKRDLIKGFFPWITSWDTVYLVRFNRDRQSGNPPVKFIVTGILGEGEAEF